MAALGGSRARRSLVGVGLVVLLASALAAVRAPTAAAADPVVMAAGDIACDPADPNFNGGAGTASACRMRATSDLLVAAAPAAVLPLGDNQYEDGALAKYQQSYDPSWGRVKAVSRPIPGDGDYGVSGAAGYFDYFGAAVGTRGKGYYSYDVGAWHVIALNSACGKVGGCGPGSPQEQWLRADLAAHPADCTLAYFHKPRFVSGTDTTSVDTFWRTCTPPVARLCSAATGTSTSGSPPRTRTAPPTRTGSASSSSAPAGRTWAASGPCRPTARSGPRPSAR
jgi:hypothetical protein